MLAFPGACADVQLLSFGFLMVYAKVSCAVAGLRQG